MFGSDGLQIADSELAADTEPAQNLHSRLGASVDILRSQPPLVGLLAGGRAPTREEDVVASVFGPRAIKPVIKDGVVSNLKRTPPFPSKRLTEPEGLRLSHGFVWLSFPGSRL